MAVALAEIPTIDLSSWLDGSDPDGVVASVRAACETYGFVQIVGHGIPLDLQERAFDCAKTFFALPTDQKILLKKNASTGRGYEPLRSEGLQSADMPDEKEVLRIGREVSSADPTFGKHGYGANHWPNLPDEEFKTPIMEYREHVLKLACTIMMILARGLPFDCEDVFKQFMSDPVASVNLIHYPPREENAAAALGAGAHTDFGAITLLLQHPGQEGLEVLHPNIDAWIPVPTIPDTYVVNIGDVLSAWTGGLYRSAMHRVINKSTTDRYSIPLFFDGTMSTQMEALDGSAAVQSAKTVGHYFEERFARAAVKS